MVAARENSQCDVMDREMVSMLYLGDQFPSATVRLKDIRYHFISAGFELFSCATAATAPMNTGSRLVSPIVTGKTLGFGFAGEP